LVDVPDTPVTALALRLRLVDLLLGDIQLTDFEEWFTESTWDDNGVSLDALQLARSIELLLAEYTSGVWTLPEVRGQLQALGASVSVAWGGPQATQATIGSTVSVIREAVLAAPSAEAGTQYVAVNA
jgi:hypothetical protein